MDSKALKRRVKDSLTIYDLLPEVDSTKKLIHCPLPNHEDKNPSFSIFAQGKLGKCQSQCADLGTLDVIGLYQKINGTSFTESLYALAKLAGIPLDSGGNGNGHKGPAKRIEKIYDYTDASGKLIYQVVRFTPKSFSQRQPNGKGGWIWSLEGVQPILYRLPEVLKAETVFVVEGEKDVDNLRSLGLTATTSPMGAGKWRPEYSDCLKGKNVIIFFDNHELGQKHGEDVAASLFGDAGSLKIVDLPGLPEKGDVSNWLQARKGEGKDLETIKAELMTLVDSTPEYKPLASDKPQETIQKRPEEWPIPIPFDPMDLPPFPTDSFPPLAKEFIETVSSTTQVDPALPGCLYLAAIATCLQKKAVMDLGTHQEQLSLYLVPIAESGERKSHTLSLVTGPLYNYQQERRLEVVEAIRGATARHKVLEARQAKLIKEASSMNDPNERREIENEIREISQEMAENPIPVSPTFIAGDDITPEALGPLMADNEERIGILSAEGGIFSILAGRYSNGIANIDLFLKSHVGDPWACHRKGSESRSMEKPALSLGLAVQTDVIKEIGENVRFRGRGLTARMLFALCQNKVGFRRRQASQIPETLLNRYERHIGGLLDITVSHHALKLSPEAEKMWNLFYEDIEYSLRPGEALEGIKDWASKLSGAVARIAGLLHFAEHGPQGVGKDISVNIVNASCSIGNYFMAHALSVFGLMAEDDRITSAKKILEYITNKMPETFKVRDVMRHKSYFRTMDMISPGVEILIERGYIREKHENPQKHNKGGRPEAATYEVNPKILKP